MQRYFMNPMDSEQTEGSDVILSESETTAASSSDQGCSQTCRKQGLDEFKAPAAPSLVSEVSKSNQHGRKMFQGPDKVLQDDRRSGSCELNEYSTIIAGNLDEDMHVPVAESTAIDLCDKDEVEARTFTDVYDVDETKKGDSLDRTIGGGLELPMKGTKHVVIGNIPSDESNKRQISCPQSQTRISLPDRHHTPFFNPQDNFLPRSPHTPKAHQVPQTPRTPKTPASACKLKHVRKTPRTPKTPSSACRLNPQEMLQIFQSPLPLEVTPPKSKRKGESTPSPSAFKFRFEQDFTNRDILRPSPLAKALRKMKEAAVEADLEEKRSPRCKTQATCDRGRSSGPKTPRFDETFVISTKSRSPNLAHRQSDKAHSRPNHVVPNLKRTPSADVKPSTSMPQDEYIDEQHDTYEFHGDSTVRSATNSRTIIETKTEKAQLIESKEDDCVIVEISSSSDELSTKSRHSNKSNLTADNQDQGESDVVQVPPSESMSTPRCDVRQRWKDSPKKKLKLLESTADNKHRDGKQKTEHLLKLENKSSKQMLERNDLQFSTIEPSSQCRNSEGYLKDQNSPLTSTPIKKVNNQHEGSTPVRSKSGVFRIGQPYQKKVLSKKTAVNSPDTPKSRYLEMQRHSESDDDEITLVPSQHEAVPGEAVCKTSSKKLSPKKTAKESPLISNSKSVLKQTPGDVEENIPVRTEQDKSSKKIVSRKTTKDSPLTPKLSQKHHVTKSSSKKTMHRTSDKDSLLTPKLRHLQMQRPTQGDAEEISLTRSEISDVSRSVSKRVLSRTTSTESPVTPKSRNFEKQRQVEVMYETGQTEPKARYVKKCVRKLSGVSPKKDVTETSISDSSCRSVTLHSTDTHCDTSGINSSMSTSSVVCEGPGLCTKMFCFTCAVSELS